MKIRSGFVSNSSSTSYTVLLPKGFTVDHIDWERKWIKETVEEYSGETEELRQMVGKALKDLIDGETVYGGEWADVYPYAVYNVLREGLNEYIIARAEGGASGADSIAGAKLDKITAILAGGQDAKPCDK